MKKFSLFITILLVVLFFVSCQADLNEKLSHECLKRYLKDRGVNEETIEYVDSYVGSITDCESAVKGKLADIYDSLRNQLNGNRNTRPYIDCIMQDIEEDDDISYEFLVLRETAVEMISGWRFWKYFSKSSALESIRNDKENIEKKSLIKCKGNRQFGELFNNIQDKTDKTVSWEKSNEEEYCIRKVLIEKNQINPNIYNFRDNPKNVRKETLNCEEIYKEVVDNYYKEIKNETSDCIMDVYQKNGFADFVLKAEVLSKLTLTRSDKSKERQNFINEMVGISYDTKNC